MGLIDKISKTLFLGSSFFPVDTTDFHIPASASTKQLSFPALSHQPSTSHGDPCLTPPETQAPSNFLQEALQLQGTCCPEGLVGASSSQYSGFLQRQQTSAGHILDVAGCPLTSSLTLGKLPNLFEPRVSYL